MGLKKKHITLFLSFALFTSALWVIHRELGHFSYFDIRRAITAIPSQRILLSFFCSIVSYLLLTGNDLLALLHIGRRIPYGKTIFASFLSYAISYNVGFSMFSSGSIRYRLYSPLGLSLFDVGQITAFCGMSFWIGALALGGGAFLLGPPTLFVTLGIHWSARTVGILCLSLLSGIFLLSFWGKTITLAGHTIKFPSTRLLSSQLVLATFDWLSASLVLFLLLPSSPDMNYLSFLGLFVICELSGGMSQVPGGLGVFDSLFLVLLSPHYSSPTLMGALLIYRLIYYILPLLIATFSLMFLEASVLLKGKPMATSIFSAVSPSIPIIFSILTFISGLILLASGATPGIENRLLFLKKIFPLALLETSHFLGSITGLFLLFLSRGLALRLREAHTGVVLLLISGVAFSLFKGADYEEAIVLLIVAISLAPARKIFYRRSRFMEQPFSFTWFLLITTAVASIVWLGLFSFRHVPYSHELWWQVAFEKDAPRFLRMFLGVTILTLCFSLWRLSRPAHVKPSTLTAEDLSLARMLVSLSPEASSALALTGDKYFLFSSNKNAMIMYQVRESHWIAMGDPIGDVDDGKELIWLFTEMADRYGGQVAFYEVGETFIDTYIELGFSLIKIGEKALVSLEDFSLEGSHFKSQRHTISQKEKEGVIFKIYPPQDVLSILSQLKEVSDGWLSTKNTKEKGFSLGFFSESYIASCPVAVLIQDNTIIAFANVWEGANKKTLSIDLMRYRPDTSPGLMDYLFLKLILFGKDNGFKWFDLGMAPLSGLRDHRLAPLWNRLGHLIYRHGEHFYNFQGIRQYKDKYRPIWVPQYLAFSPKGPLTGFLLDLSLLISGGFRGLWGK